MIEPTRSQVRRLRVYEVGCFALGLLVLVFLSILYLLGSSSRWTPVPVTIDMGFLPEAERVLLAGDGAWLVWMDSTRNVVGASNLGHPGEAVFLRPPPNAGVRPIEVIEGDLLVLLSIPSVSLGQVMTRGWHTLTAADRQSSHVDPVDIHDGNVRVQLQRIDLNTGKVRTSANGPMIHRAGEVKTLSEFESGYVAVSPDKLNVAWWRAKEEIGATPLSATVTECLQILSSGPKLRALFEKEIRTDGSLSTRSRLLEWVGRPLWMSGDRCLVFSLADSGSLIPLDCRQGTAEATVPLANLGQTLRDTAPDLVYDPDGFEVLRTSDGNPGELLFWGRTPDALHLFVLGPFFQLIRHSRVESKNLDLVRMLWLQKSQVLLVKEVTSSRLVGLSGKGERKGTYPIPPDWDEGFTIIGERQMDELIGYNRGLFLRTKAGNEAWETLELFR